MVKFAIIGIGAMGVGHLENFEKGRVPNGELVAICDIDESIKEKYPKYKFYKDYKKLIDSGEVDCVLIATPHYSHTYIGAYALEHNVHTIVEKPISVHKNDCLKLINAHKNKDVIFSAMFCVREHPYNQKVKELIPTLGEIKRINYIITDWFRNQAYYNSGTWRASWEGEGGGILANQCPHNLDLLYWWFGSPKSVLAEAKFGHYHNIEVEDEVNAMMTYENGATCLFSVTTGEFPGTNRLEVAGDKGKLILENGKIDVWYNETTTSEFSKTSPEPWSTPKVAGKMTYEFTPMEDLLCLHSAVVNNVIDAIEKGEKLLAPAEEGIYSVEIANAMILSTIKNKKVQLPLDPIEYENVLKELIKNSKN